METATAKTAKGANAADAGNGTGTGPGSGATKSAHAHASTGGKFILTGEHAVVHGRKAIACPFQDYSIHACVATRVDTEWYSRTHPLIQHSMAEIGFDRWFDNHPDQQLFVDGDLPVGIGLGASAAVVAALIRVDEQLNDRTYAFDEALALGRRCEDFVHGRSSGLDVAVAWKQKPIVFCSNGIDVSTYTHEQHFALVNTGAPTHSTGECVQKVGEDFPGDAGIWDDFADVCETILRDSVTLDAIRRNHALLCEIGVVPRPVQRFIAAIEEAGGAAKISGGGNIDDTADAAGVVIVTGVSAAALKELCDAYGYSPLTGQH